MAEKSASHQGSWDDDFSKYYAGKMEDRTILQAIALSKMLKVKEAKTIVEIGCGSGELSLYLLQNLPSCVKYISLDASEAMIAIAKQKKEAIKHKLNNIDHTFVVGSAEDLSFIPDESVDVFIAPLVIHHVPDYNKAVQEGLRVLKKGGRFGFSERGPSEKCTWHTIPYKVMAEFKANQQTCGHQHGEHQHSGEHHNHSGEQNPSGFYSGQKASSGYDAKTGHFGVESPFDGTKEGLIRLANAHGIKVDYCWEADLSIDTFEEDFVDETIKNPRHSGFFKGLDEETLVKVKERLRNEFAEATSNYTPLKFNILFLVGRKPE